MRNLLNPKWLFVINTLPLVVLFFLFFGQFNIIKTLLEDSSIQLWKSFGLSLGLLGLLNFAYAVYLTLKKKNVSVWFGLIALLCYIPFIYLYGYHLDKIIPFSIPQWMVSGNIFLYVGTFLMPTLAYSLFVLVSHFTPENKEHKAWMNFLIAIGIPIAGYIFTQIILPLWQPFDRDFSVHAMVILVITATLVFLFFLIRGVFILATKKAEVWQKYQLAWKIPIAIVLPLIGLAVNNGHLFNNFGPSDSGIFGDFNNAWFYILAAFNGILVCLPNLENKLYRLLVFIGRSVTFAYTFYFFLVFLPFLPLSVIAIIAIGTGFLMLTPLLLFIIQINELSKDFTYLKTQLSKKLIIGISLLSFLVIPAFITITYLKDKSVLNETLSYLYSPDYSKQYEIDKVSLQKTLNVIKSHKDHRDSRGGIFGNGIPYLSSYFNWLVMNNLTLSDSKINTIEKIFFGKTSFELRPENIQNDNVQISNISTNSTYDKSQNAWKSWVDLEITNKSGNTWFSEYATTINLPEGCWISDYYLYVGDVKEPGILAEKKSAMWIFSQIRNENRDPGILYYLTGYKVAFRVFPFAKDEVRKTGIEFLHREPITLNIDNNIIELGNIEETIYEKIETENIAYVSVQQKQKLNSVKRKPYFHFLVDASKNQNRNSTDFIKRIEQVIEANQPLSEHAKISFVNSYVTTTTLDKDWKEEYKNQTFEGGYYLDRAIRTTLFNAYQDKSKTYPVIVVVTDSIQNAVFDKDFADLKFTFPESDLFFNLDKKGNFREHSLTENPIKELPEILRECMFCETVLEYKLTDNSVANLANNNQPSIILRKDIFEVSETEIKEKNWQSALTMQGQWTSQILHPEISDKEWLNMVKYSFISKVMTPVTSYLVVENEAQKAMLKKKQEQALSGNKSLDLGEDTQRMSEPSLILLTILLGLVIWYREKRKRQWTE
ncbi:MSEP-CTERM sorting domain-containing protein [Flavobacterium sp. NRK F7]|uniref:MSEP-CTERM sorting domain-containing protein n=1 Tax=Flavobacterium sp. NRK F7 TaxID=2954930 RepID=UPI0020917194|nr:MSEP-CTERM sorting domain-containing protein [Flavobacterium sp. NRK F7]MCO6164480.1 MSEP-CTERM sorting domain-containing protein [Flavobacterium sp. NRK F7]